MADRSFLDWPFLDDHHRRLAAELEEWAARELHTIDHDDVDGTCRELVRRLATGGWLTHATARPDADPAHPLDVRALYRAEGAPDVRRWHLTRYDEAAGLEPETLAFEPAGSTAFGDVVLDRYRLHHSGRFVLPVVHLHPRSGRAARAVVDFGLSGKAGPAEWPLLLAHLKEGREVLTFDPRGLGETRMRYRATSVDDPSLAPEGEEEAYANPLSGVLANHVYNAQLLGRPYVLEMVEDVEIVARFAREQLGVRTLALAGRDGARAVAALGAVLLPDLELVNGGDLGFWAESLERGRETWPIPLLLPAGATLEPSRHR